MAYIYFKQKKRGGNNPWKEGWDTILQFVKHSIDNFMIDSVSSPTKRDNKLPLNERREEKEEAEEKDRSTGEFEKLSALHSRHALPDWTVDCTLV